MSSGNGAPGPESAGPECGSADVRQLRAEAADLCRRISRLECDRLPSGRTDCKAPNLDAPTAFIYGALSMLVMIALLD